MPGSKGTFEEFKKGKLHSGSKKGPVVSDPKQAIAIALSQGRKAGEKIPKKPGGKNPVLRSRSM